VFVFVAGVHLVGVKELVDGLHRLQQLLLHKLKLSLRPKPTRQK
jgi:hypothetical protein